MGLAIGSFGASSTSNMLLYRRMDPMFSCSPTRRLTDLASGIGGTGTEDGRRGGVPSLTESRLPKAIVITLSKWTLLVRDLVWWPRSGKCIFAGLQSRAF